METKTEKQEQEISSNLRRVLRGRNLYQTHTWAGEELNEGIRGVERRKFIDVEHVRGKTVLDLGCASGAESIWAYEMGAELVLGIDKGAFQIDLLNKCIASLDASRMQGVKEDLRRISIDLRGWHTVFAFAITHHLGYRRIWEDVPDAEVVYVEGGEDSPMTVESLSSEHFTAKLLGYTPANRLSKRETRPLFLLTRNQ